MQKYLPTNDLLFKKMLTSEDSPNILKAFVRDLLGIEFKTLTPKETYHIDSYKQSYDETAIFRTEVDILAIAEDSSHTTIECQIQSHAYFHERAIFYLAEAFRAPFGNLGKKEAEKKNNFSSLRPAYGINIVDFHLFNRKEPALQQFRLLSKETSRPFLNKEGKELLILCFLSLKNETIDQKSAPYHWQYFLKTGEVMDAAPDYIKEAKRKTDFLTLEREEKEMIMKIDKSKAIHDAVFATAIEEAEEKGIKEGIKKGIQRGIAQGREEEKRELAINLLKTDLSITKISEDTGLDVKVVEQLKAEQD
ncbi:Rpn family recombination-promoting nuclease/putative transposase [Enterococcus sp.]|uniref:Rpn family recombination-promoting nuclease/putative transposase n=1 Tax=Enterococcus sp. TaxID=35783 RepID=UPI0029089ED1|nr:Rpn family recombination-promoting nuclease/putative transposase [Enterococcus sp.]MDU5334980.1 Rpn family recombination-promoting nuclease/putative transposase [Enterococcus sp.]